MSNVSADKNRRVLVIDDNRAIHDDFRKILSPPTAAAAALDATEAAVFGRPVDTIQQIQFQVDSAYQGQEGVALIKKAQEEGQPYAMAFVDVRMPPGWDGVETTQKIWEVDPQVQIVLCTAYSDYSWGEMFEKLGHHDGLLILKKPFDSVEALQLAFALTEKWWLHRQSQQKMTELERRVAERTHELQNINCALRTEVIDHERAEGTLRESDEKFRQLADNITDAFWIRSPDMREVHYISPAFERIWGRSVESLYANPQQWTDFILPEDRERVLSGFAALTGDTSSLDIEYRIERTDGEARWVRVRGYQVRDAAGKLIRLTGIVSDITERKQLEAQLFQSQKMETVGKLAGGVAHEFNSILTAIIGRSELLLSDLPSGSPNFANALAIRKAADLAAALTKQLLAYGRKQLLRSEPLNLNQIVSSMEGMLGHLMGSGVDVSIVPAVGLPVVKVDAGQIEQVIMNIAINAREAMPAGGKLMLETSTVTLDEEYVHRFPELKAGDYVMLAISDTGTGMSEKVKEHLFEPFFTTKGVGEGTGLGLATCHGIIKQSGGHINFYSELGRGTTFKIYLPPYVEQRVAGVTARLALPDLPGGTETILLVEDDLPLREMATLLLRRLGYTVLVAANGAEGLKLTQEQDKGPIDLLFTDIVMPQMDGKELSNRIHLAHPLTKTLFTSAYTENAAIRQGVLNEGVALLQKPFTPSALALKVRVVLDGHA